MKTFSDLMVMIVGALLLIVGLLKAPRFWLYDLIIGIGLIIWFWRFGKIIMYYEKIIWKLE